MRKRTIVTTLALLTLGACGDSSTRASFPVDTGKSIDALTDQEVDAICDEMLAVMRASFDKGEICMMGAGLAKSFGASQQQCESAYQSCVQRDGDLYSGYRCSLKENPAAAKACKATAKELETCVNDSLRALDDYLSDLSCSSSKPAPSEPRSCLDLASKCPGIS
jgi:hypothetical protein